MSSTWLRALPYAAGVSVVARNPDVLHATVGDELVLLNVDTLAYFEFNEVGVDIWQMLEAGPLPFDAVVERLMAEYDVDEARCRGAVSTFVASSQAKGLLVVAPS
ncbi:MAG: hypothetical protein RLZ55_1423 [Actinomycetota bacterium]